MFEAFRASGELRGELRNSFEKMCWFYGFVVEDGEEEGEVLVCVFLRKHQDEQFWGFLSKIRC